MSKIHKMIGDNMDEIKPLDTAESLAKFLNCGVSKIRKDTKKGLPCIRFGRLVRYDRERVLKYLRWSEAQGVKGNKPEEEDTYATQE